MWKLASFLKKSPQPVKNIVVRTMYFNPTLYYLYRTINVYLKGRRQWSNLPPLISNYAIYESLFRDAECNFEAVIKPYISEFRWMIGRVYNGAFESIDVELYYSLVRTDRPELIIEVGSGHSTCFALDAVKKNGHGHIISIDPEPRRKLPKIVKHIKSKVQDVDVSIFNKLGGNDILFIDSSYTSEEATYHIKKIFPHLRSGVIIHHHDIFYPYERYYYDNPVTFGEPNIVLNFYLKNRGSYKIMTSCSYVRYKNPELILELIKSFNWNLGRIGGSLWAKKK